MKLKTRDSIDSLTRGDVVDARLRRYFSRQTQATKLVYLHTEQLIPNTQRFTFDYFISQNPEPLINPNQILEYCLSRTHTDVEKGRIKCYRFSIEEINPWDKTYSERKELIETVGLWTPEKQRESKEEEPRTKRSMIEPCGLFTYSKGETNQLQTLAEMLTPNKPTNKFYI